MTSQNPLACYLCLEEYNPQSHITYLLHECGHSYCSECLKSLLSIYENRVICPQCRKPSYGSKLSDFSINLEILHSLDRLKDQAQPTIITSNSDCALVKQVPFLVEHYYHLEPHWSNQDVYKGEWKNGNLNGFGEYHFAMGGVYKGNWKDGLMHGKGECCYKDNSTYKGEWNLGKKEGYGEFYSFNGECYVGNWKNGHPDGKGGYFYSDGSRYVGEWREGKKHGYGTYFFSNGKIFSGEWRDGLPVQSETQNLKLL